MNKRLNKLIHPYHRTPLSKKKKWTIDIYNSLDGSPEYYAETEKYSQPLTVINIFCMILFLLHSLNDKIIDGEQMSDCQRLETWGRGVWREGVQEGGGYSYKRATWDFPGGPVSKIPHSQCRGPGFDPWSGN